MSTRYQVPTGDKRELSAQLFTAMRQMRELKRTREPSNTDTRIGFERLYAYAVEPDVLDPELDDALQADETLREDFQRLLDRTAMIRVPRVAAASPGTIMSRDGDGCRIRFQASRAEPNQTYVIIELTDKEAKAPAHLFVVDTENRCRKFPLPAARNGIIQFLVEQESDLLVGLLDIKTEVYLR